jgi:hypothetical protein
VTVLGTMRIPSNITQFQPAAERSNEACRLITDAIMHELPEADELYVGPDEQIYAIVFDGGRTRVGRASDFDADADAADEVREVGAPAGLDALAANAADRTIAFATPVERTPLTGSQEIVTWAISSYVPEQFATATLLTVVYWREIPHAAVGQSTQYWAADQLTFDEATENAGAWVDAEIHTARQRAAELTGMLALGGGA